MISNSTAAELDIPYQRYFAAERGVVVKKYGSFDLLRFPCYLTFTSVYRLRDGAISPYSHGPTNFTSSPTLHLAAMAYPYNLPRLLHHALRWVLHHHRVHHTRLPGDGVSRVRCFIAYPFVSPVVHLIQLPPNYPVRMLHPPMGDLTP